MLQAATHLDEGRDDPLEVATAKFWAADGGNRIAHAALHIHGGVSIDVDFPIHRYFLWLKRYEFTARLGHAGVAADRRRARGHARRSLSPVFSAEYARVLDQRSRLRANGSMRGLVTRGSFRAGVGARLCNRGTSAGASGVRCRCRRRRGRGRRRARAYGRRRRRIRNSRASRSPGSGRSHRDRFRARERTHLAGADAGGDSAAGDAADDRDHCDDRDRARDRARARGRAPARVGPSRRPPHRPLPATTGPPTAVDLGARRRAPRPTSRDIEPPPTVRRPPTTTARRRAPGVRRSDPSCRRRRWREQRRERRRERERCRSAATGPPRPEAITSRPASKHHKPAKPVKHGRRRGDARPDRARKAARPSRSGGRPPRRGTPTNCRPR